MADLQHIALTTKPTAQISYTFHPPTTPSSTTPPPLLIFLNGLGLPQASWFATIANLQESNAPLPALLTYDRYGQGSTTDRDPADAGAEDPTHGHDCLAVVRDLRQLITQIASEKLDVKSEDVDSIPLILVANSIGCALARLYAHEYPRTVAGLVLLDSVLANSDFVSIFPDPDAGDFDPASLPEGIPADALRAAREGIARIFHPSVGSKEGLSRKNLASLLPDSHGPALIGPDGKGPWVTVVGHDFDTFAKESARMPIGGRGEELTKTYVNPYWNRYNEGLVKITREEGRGKGPVIAEGAGHFIQKDRADLVAGEVLEVLGKVL
ncbi:alpha/beta-hydrolase [Aspergillus pseudodeflectus]|uniref:Alpha/beta-hydrolase n=1 Tax=Aspergillus pseudodeflectus TaxID=176178 RepID=A0ABR4KAJ2_9EURO